ncbi:MAG: hypothetical protein M5U15_06355 [Kiritimatiellae bacterium]|nr:hypothetical protein [Kiritimatiellia bacterium]
MKPQKTSDASEAMRPLLSLIGKSEKAQQKLAPGSWQYAMLRDHLCALRLATRLLNNRPPRGASLDELKNAVASIDAMIAKTKPSLTRFAPGTPHRSLAQNRLFALRAARAAISSQSKSAKKPVGANQSSSANE